ncbi:MAG: phenylalanine--tRNA ligase subunit beta [Planctomycetaceae bacterium]|nr:phenylalanine--tRNA ligase subunit beta [Planctomycetaceae bacterium]
MFISLDWISDYVDLTGLTTEEIVSRLTLATAEIEGTKTVRRFVKSVVIGEIIEIKKLDGKLSFCKVALDEAKKNIVQTVCGAPNVKVGLKVPFAPAGTTLANDVKITESELADHKSQGILCSAAELGMSDWHEIVLECPPSLKNGTPLETLIPETDTLLEFDNKSLTHRPDLWGHYGFAREFSAVFQRPLKPLPQVDLSQYDNLPAYPLKNNDYENCPCYGCIEFNTHGTVPSPLFIQRRLHALGLRSANLLVDVTNYVNWEIGQPTHAFDADKLGGILIQTMGKEADFITLDGQTRKLLPDDIIIWGTAAAGVKRAASAVEQILPSAVCRLPSPVPVAIAGIMGGRETEVAETTTKLLLESANFKAARVRKTSGRLDLRTDASQRYEKSQPPSNVKTGTARILKLIEEAGAGLTVLSKFTMDGDLQEEIRHIEIAEERLEQLAGIKLPPEKVQSILTSLGFTVEVKMSEQVPTLKVGVPPFRSKKDISIPEDIVEEILRVFGFDNIPPVMPALPLKTLHIEKPMKMQHKIKKILAAGHRFLEVHQYIWFNDLWLKNIGFEPSNTLVLKNATTPETSRLRTTLIPGLLALVPKNRTTRDSFRLFEIGRCFFPTGKNKECNEVPVLGGVAFQQSGSIDTFYLSIKSAVEDVLKICGITDFRFADSEESCGYYPWQTEGSFVVLNAKGYNFGALGVLDKTVLEKVSPEGGQVVWFEVNLSPFDGETFGELYPKTVFTEPPRYPLSWQDFSLVWNIDDGFAQLESLLDTFKHPLSIRREFLISYKGKGLEKGTASYSFRYWIGASDRTLSGEDIDGFHNHFLSFIAEKGIALRQ